MNDDNQTQLHASSNGSLFPVADMLGVSHREAWVAELAHWYEADWKLALQGGAPPEHQLLISVLDESRQSEASEVLNFIEKHYRSRFRGGSSPTANVADDPTVYQPIEPAVQPSIELDEPTAVLRASPELKPSDVTMPLRSDPTAGELTEMFQTANQGSFDFSVGQKSSRASSSEVDPKTFPRIPGYEIKSVLGRGGMGIVYRAWQEGIGRDVALKMVLAGAHASQETLDRFQAEARAVGRFQHENIVRIFDIGTHDRLPYFSLEFVDGNTLSERIDGKPMDPIEAARIIEPLARALGFAHRKGVVHRDMKPGNVLLTQDCVPKVSDFGLAKQLEDGYEHSRTGDVVGTPSYMAPEQALGEKSVGAPADIYSLGAVLYCTLTGRPPFLAAKSTDTLIQLLHEEPVSPIRLQPGIPKDLETICLKCLQKEPEKRYEDADALADDLRRFVAGEPISARPITRVERVIRWSRRKPKQAALVATAIGLGGILMIGGPATAAIINSQKKEVVKAKQVAEKNEQDAQIARKQAEENARQAAMNAQLAQENEAKADRNAEVALDQQKNAVDALKSLVFEVQRTMQDKPQLRALRQSLLNVATDGLKRMDASSGNSNAQNMIAAAIDRRLGDVNLELGRVSEAKVNYERCLEKLLALNEQGELKNSHHNLSTIYDLLGSAARRAGLLKEAEISFAKAVELRRQWVAQSPQDGNVKQNLAASLGKLGVLLQEEGRLEQSAELLNESAQLRNDFLAENPASLSAQVEAIGSRWMLAKLELQKGELHAAIENLQRIADDLNRVRSQQSSNPAHQINYGLALNDLANAFLYNTEPAKALPLYQSAVAVLEEVTKEDPDGIQSQEILAEFLYGLGACQVDLGLKEESQKTFAESVEIRRKVHQSEPDNLARQIPYWLSTVRTHELDEPVANAIELAKTTSDPATQYLLASILSQAAGASIDGAQLPENANADELLIEAARLLDAAIASGFHRAADLRFDPNLRPLRDSKHFEHIASHLSQLN